MCFGMYNLNLKLQKNIQGMCRRFKMSFLNELGNRTTNNEICDVQHVTATCMDLKMKDVLRPLTGNAMPATPLDGQAAMPAMVPD
jgi:hypothetical protein